MQLSESSYACQRRVGPDPIKQRSKTEEATKNELKELVRQIVREELEKTKEINITRESDTEYESSEENSDAENSLKTREEDDSTTTMRPGERHRDGENYINNKADATRHV